MPLFSPDQTGLRVPNMMDLPVEQAEPTTKPAPRKRKAKTPETEQPVADQPDDPNVG